MFLINTKSIKDLDDVKSDLNGTFRKLIESKWKMVETKIGECLKGDCKQKKYIGQKPSLYENK